MMLADDGIRCDEHVGEVFPPRCAACNSLRDANVEGEDDA
jgi:hypothetical protein